MAILSATKTRRLKVLKMNSIKKIIHIDMDAFYASVEQRDNPNLKGKPVAVGWPDKRGVLTTASYEARKFGVHSAMPSVTAKKKCPDLIFVKPRFDVYKSVSKQIRAIFKEYTDLVEPLSLDEAYLDVTENKKGIPSATIIAKEIKQKIKDELHLTASAGISINKFLAKVASDMDKPDGLYVIPPEKTIEFIEKLPIEKIPGIGKVTAEKMKNININNGHDLRQFQRVELVRLFGKVGAYYYQIVRNEYDSNVVPDRVRKSISSENTFHDDLKDESEMLAELKNISESLFRSCEKLKTTGKTVTLKIKYHDFEQRTRSKTIETPVQSNSELFKIVEELFWMPEKPYKPVRLFGVGLSNLNTEERKNDASQMVLDLF